MQKIMFNDKYGLTKAVLEGRKTQTRRVALYTKEDVRVLDELDLKAKDKDIVRYVIDKYSRYKFEETVAVAQSYQNLWETEPKAFACTEASQVKAYYAKHYPGYTVEQINRSAGWKNKMFVKADLMPNQIRISNIRLERLQDISDEDCLKEGIIDDCPGVQYSFSTENGYCGQYPFDTPKAAYAALIDKVSGKGTWERNPWIFVYDFKLVKKTLK